MHDQRNFNTITGRTDVDHIPALPLWLLLVRVFQLVLAIIIVGLVGFASSQFVVVWDGYAMTFFTFVWTIFYIAYLIVSTLFAPAIYNLWANLGLEALTNVWWLVTWALLASEASAWTSLDYGFGFETYLPGGWNSAINCTKAASGLGALEWVLFCASLAILVLTVIRTHNSKTTTTTTPTTATTQPGVATAAPMEQHNMQPIAVNHAHETV